MPGLLEPTHLISDYNRGAAEFADAFEAGERNNVPTLLRESSSHRDSLEHMDSVYSRVGQPGRHYRFAPSTTVRALPGLLRLLQLLTSRDPDAPVVPVALHEELDLERLDKNVDRVLVARSVDSLTWLLAKQFLVARDDLADLHVNAVYPETRFPADVCTVGSETLQAVGLPDEVLRTPWRRVLVFANGHEHIGHLGRDALCGMVTSPPRNPGRSLRCVTGGRCTKDAGRVIPVGHLRSAHVTLSNCDSGPDRVAAVYQDNLLLHLAAVDGIAREVVCLRTVADSGVPECEAWLRSPGRESTAMNDSLAAVNSYRPYYTIGLE